ncbi:DUF192 domain-containing protein [Albimonas sp. CAU 1670]|uniref:DUF192 domain-containing protein n=1 Tax=Albimonas sp. CAU 1670 TaxID=3032599 RepID=UPI0023D9CC0E|nr:DUF192 domain-containing protein [Albimonas sp. CAU 1670]MDF2232152.1 DUF192 domain-containing protein [Albimonas sp. CAU 1670]
MTLRTASILGLAVAAAMSGPALAACREGVVDLKSDGAQARFTVEIADDPEERARGLMHREEMAAGHGMLFLFDEPRPVAFWMKNTPLPLDMIFLDETGVVLNVIANAEPFTEDPRPSEGDTRAVLEINGGLAERYGIAKGTLARHPAFGTQAAWPCD